MDVLEKLLQFKFHFIFLTLFSILVALIVTYSSSAVTVFSYFWPLVVSIGLFFAAVVIFGSISPSEADCPARKQEQNSSTMSLVIHDLNAGDLADNQRGEGEDLAASDRDTEDFGGGGKDVGAEVKEGVGEEGGVGALRASLGWKCGAWREGEGAAEVGFVGGSGECSEGAADAVGRASLSFQYICVSFLGIRVLKRTGGL